MRRQGKTLVFLIPFFLAAQLSTAGQRIVLGEYFTGTW